MHHKIINPTPESTKIQIIVERDSNTAYEFPPQELQNLKKQEINKRSNLKDLLQRYDSNSTAASNESKEPKENLNRFAGLQDLSPSENCEPYRSYFSHQQMEEAKPKKNKRSYYWKINELAILHMVTYPLF